MKNERNPRVHRDKYAKPETEETAPHSTTSIREPGRNVAKKVVKMTGQPVESGTTDSDATLLFLQETKPVLPKKGTGQAIKRP